jgi:hypothetical protein
MVAAVAVLLFQFSNLSLPADLTAAVPDRQSTAAPTVFALNLPDTSSAIANIAAVPTTSAAQPQVSVNSVRREAASDPHPAALPARAAAMNPDFEIPASLALVQVPDKSQREHRFISLENSGSRRRWIALAAAEHAAAAFDAYTTRYAISRGAVEQDPFMRPFANSSAIYAAIQVGPVVLDIAARRMQRSQNGFLRRTWWLPQSVSAGMFVFSGAHNLRVAGQQ